MRPRASGSISPPATGPTPKFRSVPIVPTFKNPTATVPLAVSECTVYNAHVCMRVRVRAGGGGSRGDPESRAEINRSERKVFVFRERIFTNKTCHAPLR